MFIGMGMPIPDLANLPGTSRPGSGGGATPLGTISNQYSMLFDGTDQYISVDPVDLGVDGSMTLWFKPATGAGTDYALIGENSSGFDYLIRRQSGSFYVAIGSNYLSFTGISGNILTNSWNFLGVSKTAGNVDVYLYNSTNPNGVNTSVTNAAVSSLNLKFDRIGARTNSTGILPFDGHIDEVAGFNYALTEAQIKEIYDATDVAVTADLSTMATPPVAWYRMGD